MTSLINFLVSILIWPTAPAYIIFAYNIESWFLRFIIFAVFGPLAIIGSGSITLLISRKDRQKFKDRWDEDNKNRTIHPQKLNMSANFSSESNERTKYNNSVDLKLNNEYQIITRDNQRFPGVLAYLELIDNAVKAKMTVDEAALYIATLYYCGLIKHGFTTEAIVLDEKIQTNVELGLSKGFISKDRWDKFSAAIDQANQEAGFA